MAGFANLNNYTFDLGKLEESSNLQIKDRKRNRPTINSEEDGPEDFTLNMEKWMRGTGPYKQGEGPEDESEFLPQAESTPSPVRHQQSTAKEAVATPIRPQHSRKATVEDAADVESPLRLPTPRMSRMNTETKQERAAEEVFDHIAALQAEVQRLMEESEQRLADHRKTEEAMGRIEEENEKLQERLQGDDAKAQELQAANQEHSAVKKHLQEENVKMQADNQKLYTRLQDTDSTAEGLRTENDELSAAKKQLEKEKLQMQTDYKKLQERQEDSIGLVKELQAENEERIDSNKQLEEEIEQMQADNQKLFTRLEDTNAMVKELQSENEEQFAASKRLREENARLETENRDFEHDR